MGKIRLTIILGVIFLIPIFYLVSLYFLRREKQTEVQFPKEYISTLKYCQNKTIKKMEFAPNQIEDLQKALNSLEECTHLILKSGKFIFDNSLSIARVNGIILQGSGKSKTILDFQKASNVNGVDVEAVNSFTIQDLSILDSPKNGLEIRLSENILIENIIVSWSTTSGPEMSKNGAYGVYPVNVVNVLLQNTETYYASDAGIYIGQCINALVRNNKAEYNVMGLEIENTINAEVYGNLVQNNTGGFLAYDLHKNTIVSRNIKVYNNKIVNNNFPNFSAAGIVRTVPSGTGIILTSVREVELFSNTIGENHTVDVAILNGLVSQTSDFSQWAMNNWRVYNIYIHDNSFIGNSGTSIDNGNIDEKNRPLGALANLFHEVYNKNLQAQGKAKENFANILYDGVEPGFTILALTKWFGNKSGNYNQICIGVNDKGTISPSFLDFNLPALLANSSEPTEDSILSAIQKKESRVYTSDTNYGGVPTEGFGCEGYIAKGLPIDF